MTRERNGYLISCVDSRKVRVLTTRSVKVIEWIADRDINGCFSEEDYDTSDLIRKVVLLGENPTDEILEWIEDYDADCELE